MPSNSPAFALVRSLDCSGLSSMCYRPKVSVAHRSQNPTLGESLSNVSKNRTKESPGRRFPFSNLGEPRARAKTSASGRATGR